MEEYIGKRGILFVKGSPTSADGFGFLRSPEHTSAVALMDIDLSPALVAQYGPRSSRSRSAVRRGTSVTSRCCASSSSRRAAPSDTDFDGLMPVTDRIELETDDPNDFEMRVISTSALPIGFGDRRAAAPEDILLQRLARAVARNHPDAHLTACWSTSGRKR